MCLVLALASASVVLRKQSRLQMLRGVSAIALLLVGAWGQDCVFAELGGNMIADISGGRRCGSMHGASDTTSAMCAGATDDGIYYLPESAMRALCAQDSACAGYGKHSAAAFLRVDGAPTLDGLDRLCQAFSGRLASIVSVSENVLAQEACGGTFACFIGLRWQNTAWRYLDGSPYNSSGCCQASSTSFSAFVAWRSINGLMEPCVAYIDGGWQTSPCPSGTMVNGLSVAGLCRIPTSFVPVTSISTIAANQDWATYKVVSRERCNKYPQGYFNPELPTGFLLTLHFRSGRTLTGQAGGLDASLSLPAGEPVQAVTLELPVGSLFDVGGSLAAASLHLVPAGVLQSDAAKGACQSNTIFGGQAVGDDVVDAPMSSTSGLLLSDAKGTQSIQSLFPLTMTIWKAGLYRFCYSYDGSFLASRAQILPISLEVQGVVSSCTGNQCLSKQFSNCYMRLGEAGRDGICGLALEGVLPDLTPPADGLAPTSNVRVSWSPRVAVSFGGDGKPNPTVQDAEWVLTNANTTCAAQLLRSVDSRDLSVSQCEDIVMLDSNCGSQLVHGKGVCMCTVLGELCDLQAGNAGYNVYEARKNALGRACPIVHEPDQGSFLGQIVAVSSDSAIFPATQPVELKTQARTLAMCFCASIEDCSSFGEYWQQIGVVFLFVAHVTSTSTANCLTDSYSAVLAPLQFIVCVRCAPGGCPYGVPGSSIRLVSTEVDIVETPSWNAGHHCHGPPNSTVLLLPQGVASSHSDGGLRSDYKRFAPVSTTPGFSLPYWPNEFRPGTDLDVCLCLIQCEEPMSWFKAAQLDVVEPRLLSSVAVPAIDQTAYLPTLVGKPGRIAIEASMLYYGNPPAMLGFSSMGSAKLLDFDPTGTLSPLQVCQQSVLQGTVPLLTLAATLRNDMLVFDNHIANYNVSIQKLSTPVVCYCETAAPNDPGLCLDTGWVSVGLISVGGPLAGQYWLLTTFRKVRLEYRGRELRGTDTLRFVTLNGLGEGPSCEEAPPVEVVCPMEIQGGQRICQRDGVMSTGEYIAQVLSQDTVNCDEMNANCGAAHVESLRVSDDGNLLLTFTNPPTYPSGLGELGLATDDNVVLDGGQSGITCDGSACTPLIEMDARGFAPREGLKAYYDFEENSPILSMDEVLRRRALNIPIPVVYVQDRVDYGFGLAELVITSSSSWRLADANSSCDATCAQDSMGMNSSRCDIDSENIQDLKDSMALQLAAPLFSPSVPLTPSDRFSGWRSALVADPGLGSQAELLTPKQTDAAYPMYWKVSRGDCPMCYVEYLLENKLKASTCAAASTSDCPTNFTCQRICFCIEAHAGDEYLGFAWVQGFKFPNSHALRIFSASGEDHVALRAGVNIDAARPWTLSLWLRTNRQVGEWRTICGFSGGPHGARHQERGEVEIGIAGDGSSFADIDGALFLRQAGSSAVSTEDHVAGAIEEMVPIAWNPSGWTHVAVVYSGDGVGDLAFYVNGTLSYARNHIDLFSTALPLYFGGGAGRTTTSWLEIDEVRFYSAALSFASVRGLFAPAPRLDYKTPASGAVGIRVSSISSDSRTFQIPSIVQRWGSRAADVRFRVNGRPGGAWRRTNRAVTKEEIMRTEEGYMRVCWGREGALITAGTIRFKHPAAFSNVGVWMTGTELGQYGIPFVLIFSTQPAYSDVGFRYRQAQGPMRLEIVIMDRSRFDVAESTYDGIDLVAPKYPVNSEAGANQAVCGRLFREMWSTDSENGFPLPHGCFYRDIARDIREIVVVFEPRNGIKGSQTYQLVMNAKVSSVFDPSKEAIMIMSVDDMYTRRYDVLEIGHAYPTGGYRLRGTKNDPQFEAGEGGLAVVYGNVNTNLLNLDGSTDLSIDMKGPSWQTGKIGRGCSLSIWLWPLTIWNLPTRCRDGAVAGSSDDLRITCSVVKGLFRRCGQLSECQTWRTVPLMGYNYNKITLTFGNDMNDLWGDLVYRLTVKGIVPPLKGSPPHKVPVELIRQDGNVVRYQMTAGRYIYAMPTPDQSAVGRLLTVGINSFPFSGESSQLIFIKILLAMDIWGSLTNRAAPDLRPDSTIRVMAPDGFTCLSVVKAPPDLGAEVLVGGTLRAGLMQSSPHEAPTGFGSPECTDSYQDAISCPVAATQGWKLGGQFCNYTLVERSIIPAGSSLVIGIFVKPSVTSMPVTDPRNKWVVTVDSPGQHNVSRVSYSFQFYRSGQGGVPVLGIIGNGALIQSSNSALSPSNATTRRLESAVVNTLQVIIPITIGIVAGGSVDVEAPQAFHFGSACIAADLEDDFYIVGFESRVYKLPDIASCTGHWTVETQDLLQPLNVARVTVVGELVPNRTYGFSVMVINPTIDAVEKRPGGIWSLRTRDAAGASNEAMDAPAPGTAGAAGRYLGPWILTNGSLKTRAVGAGEHSFLGLEGPWEQASIASPGGVGLDFSPKLPYVVTGTPSNFTLLFVLTAQLEDASLRVVAPEGFLWGLSCGADNLTVYPSIVGNVSVGLSIILVPALVDVEGTAGNVLSFLTTNFDADTLYGFSAALCVPQHAPVTSLQAFFVSLAPPGRSLDRGLACCIRSPLVRALVNASALPSSRIAGQSNYVLLQVRLATPVVHPGRLVVTVPANYSVPGNCSPPKPWPENPTWPPLLQPFASTNCSFDRVTGQFILYPAPGMPLPAGLLQWQVLLANPPVFISPRVPNGPCGAPICWTFETFADGRDLLSGLPLDYSISIPGRDIVETLYEFELLDFQPAGRDDRPGRANRLVFRFRMKSPKQMAVAEAAVGGALPPMPGGDMELVGPAGFVFATRCLSMVELRTENIFGDLWTAQNIWRVDIWPVEAQGTACEGSGRRVKFSIMSGLHANYWYAFSIAVTNPDTIPSENSWTLSVLDHFSVPAPSFDILTFSETEVTPYSRQAGPYCYNNVCKGAGVGVPVPVKLRFRVRSAVLTGGELHVYAPLDFGFNASDEQMPNKDRLTSCTVLQYWGGNMSNEPEEWRVSDRVCSVIYSGSALEGTGTGDSRSLRVRLDYLFNQFEDRAPRSFSSDSIYELVMAVIPPPTARPPALWELRTFDSKGAPMDYGVVLGYEVVKVLLYMDHSNQPFNWYAGERRGIIAAGGVVVKDFVLQWILPEIASQHDHLVLYAPPGFVLEAGPSLQCVYLRVVLPDTLAYPDATSTATCQGGVMTWPLSNLRGAMQSDKDIRLLLNISNAEEPPPPGTNFWRLEHYNQLNQLVAAAMVPSWQIVPTLSDMQSKVTGDSRAAGAITNIQISFRNVMQASEVQIEAQDPPGFDFSNAYGKGIVAGVVFNYFQVLTAQGNLFRVVMNPRRTGNNTLDILGVKLPVVSTSTRWHVTTYTSSLEKATYGQPFLSDEGVFVGFVVPGRIWITSASTNTLVPVRNGTMIFSSLVLGLMRANITFHLNITRDLLVNDIIVLTLASNVPQGYTVGDSPLELEPGSFGGPLTPVRVGGRSIAAALGTPLEAGKPFVLKCPVITPKDRATFAQERWLVEAYRKTFDPSSFLASNDKVPFDLLVSSILPTEPIPRADFAPPLCEIEVVFQLDPLDTGAEAMIIEAPAGFIFHQDCMSASQTNGDVSKDARCTLMEYNNSSGNFRGNSKAQLDCMAGGHGHGGGPPGPSSWSVAGMFPSSPLECLRMAAMALLLTTPIRTPDRSPNIFYIDAVMLNPTGSKPLTAAGLPSPDWTDVLVANYVRESLGRTELVGFQLEQMNSQITAGNMVGVGIFVGISFATRLDLPAMGRIRINAPASMGYFGCGSEALGFVQSLSFKMLQCIDALEPWSIDIVLATALPKGVQTIAVAAKTSSVQPNASTNFYEVFILGPAKNNLDVSLNIPGEPLIYGLRVNALPLRWQPGLTSQEPIHVILRVEVIDDADIPVFGIFISLPSIPQVRIHSSSTAVLVDAEYKSQLSQISTEVGPELDYALLTFVGGEKLGADVYQISLGVSYTNTTPKYNLWRLAFCNATMLEARSSCSIAGAGGSGRGAAVFSIFALPGFDARVTGNFVAGPLSAGGAVRRVSCGYTFILGFASCFLLCLRCAQWTSLCAEE